MMLPFIDAEENEIQEEQYIPKEYGINFETGQLPGKLWKVLMPYLYGHGLHYIPHDIGITYILMITVKNMMSL